MKIIITGGAGFIGGNFVHYMVNKYPNDQFICLDLLTYAGNLATIEQVMDKDNFKFELTNVTGGILSWDQELEK